MTRDKLGRLRENGRLARSSTIQPAWREYWANPLSPHPESDDVLAKQRAFPKATGFCHHYRAVDEHYHRTMEELEGCKR